MIAKRGPITNVEASAAPYDIVCASILPADNPSMPCSQAHLLRRFAERGHRVLFVNPPLRWILEYRWTLNNPIERARLTTWRQGPTPLAPNFWVVTPPPTLPINRLAEPRLYRLGLSLNQWLYRLTTRRAMRRLGLQRPVLWLALEPFFGAGLIGRLGERLTLYHCTDALEHFGIYTPELGRIEREVINRADLVVGSSTKLTERLRTLRPQAHYTPNAADIGHFQQAFDPDLAEPADLASLTRPRALYIGNFEGRVDLELIDAISAQGPEINFVFVGPVRADIADQVAAWRRPNVHLLGPKPYATLPAYLKWCDVALIPHRVNALTETMYPLKLHEYLAAGKPVISAPLAPMAPFADVVSLAGTPATFLAAIRAALAPAANTAERVAQRVSVARANDWSARVDTLVTLIADQLATTTPNQPPVSPRVAAFGQAAL